MKLQDLFEDLPGEEGFIRTWLREHGVSDKKYNINSNLTVDVDQDVVLTGWGITKLSVRFNHAKGAFHIDHNQLNSLYGCPLIVDDEFDCSYTIIPTLKGAPAYVGSTFDCSSTDIKSLESAPEYVGGNFICRDTPIVTLRNIHKQIKHIGGVLSLSNRVKTHILGVMLIKGLTGVRSDVTGKPKLKQVLTIVNKHLPNGNIHDVHEELLEAGLEEFAQL